MQEAVKKLFDAPWAIEEEAPLAWYCVIDSKDSVVANDVRDQKTVNRISHLPELYDALADAAERVCRKCVAFWFPGQKIDFPEDFSDFTCPITKAGCFCENWLNLLKKVKDGK